MISFLVITYYYKHMKQRFARYYRLLFSLGAMASFAVAVIYLLLTPEEAASVDGFQKVVLLYGHSVCWFLLCAACVLWAILKKNKWSEILAYTALAAYVAFAVVLLLEQ